MAIPIEGFTVVAKRERIQPLLDNEQVSILNATTLADDDIWRCSFMTLDDATRQTMILNKSFMYSGMYELLLPIIKPGFQQHKSRK